MRAPVARLGEQRLRLPFVLFALALRCAPTALVEALRLGLSTRSIACRSFSHHLRSMKRFSATVPVKCARCTIVCCSSVTVTAPMTRSCSVTNTLSRPASLSVHDIALQRNIGMGILVVTPALVEEAQAVALSSSSTSADIALHRTIFIIVLWRIV